MKELNSYLKEKFIVFEVNVFIVNIQNNKAMEETIIGLVEAI